MCPLMSRPRMALAFSSVSSGVEASFTPPALPRPPVLTWALTTTGWPNFAAMAWASAGLVATSPGSTGTPWAAKRSFAWYSYRSTRVSCDVGVGTPRLGGPQGAKRTHLTRLGPDTIELQVLAARHTR